MCFSQSSFVKEISSGVMVGREHNAVFRYRISDVAAAIYPELLRT